MRPLGHVGILRVAALLATLVPALTVGSLLFRGPPTSAASQSTPRTIAEMTVRTIPPEFEGHCIELEAGTLTVDLQAVGDGELQILDFSFFGYRGLDRGADIGTTVTRDPSSFGVQLTGGLYCYSFQNRAVVPAGATMAEITNLSQYVAIRMVISPAQAVNAS